MSKINPLASSLIDAYILSSSPFAKEILLIYRELIHKADKAVIEDWKWNAPVFHKNELVCGFGAFQKHVSIHFFNGAKMSDQHHLFSSDCSAKHTRTIKLNAVSDINKYQLLDYFKEAFLLGEKCIQKTVSKEIDIPELLQNALDANELAKKNFENMAYTYRKEYVLQISDAKQEATRLKRLNRIISNLEQNIKMHEQYKN